MRFGKLVRTVMVLIVLAVAAFAVAQEPQIMPITWSWTPATVGTEVVYYEGIVKIVSADSPADTAQIIWAATTADTTFTFWNYPAGSFITVNVRGVDAREVAGEYSAWADWFIYWGTPGDIQKPVFIRLGDEPIEP